MEKKISEEPKTTLKSQKYLYFWILTETCSSDPEEYFTRIRDYECQNDCLTPLRRGYSER